MKNANFETIVRIDAMTELDVQEIEKNCIIKNAQKKRDNALEFLELRKSIAGTITHKKTKNSCIVKNLTELKSILNGKKEFILSNQDVMMKDGIYPIDETRARVSFVNENGKRHYLILTIGRKDNKGRESEFLLDFNLNPQGFKIKTQ